MSVYKAINAVQASLSKIGISKDRLNTQQGAGFKFRGIDDVYNAIAPLLAEHGLCIIPRMISRQCEDRQSKSGGVLIYVTVEAEFDFVCAEDGSKATARTFGEAMDSGDKATNKAMSAAYKYACFQTFAIPTEGDNDADAKTHQVAPKSFKNSPTMGVLESLSPGRQSAMADYAEAIKERLMADDTAGAFELASEVTDSEEKTGLWSLLDSKSRSAIKKYAESLKEKV